MRLAAAGLFLAILAGCAHVTSLPSGGRYVALGSSYAAGTAIGGIKPDTPQRCGRSPKNYATLLAGRLGLQLDDQTCGGATTAHVLGPWNELAPQIAAVNAATRLVTITIGGNDLGYMQNLGGASCNASEGLTYNGKTYPCPALKPPTVQDYARLESNLRAISRKVHAQAPKARLVFVQYVKLVPDAPCPALNLSPEGALLTRSMGESLATITRRVAAETGAQVLDTDELSRDHSPCAAVPWSAGPKPLGPDANTPWHPNAAAHAAIADALEKLLQGAGR